MSGKIVRILKSRDLEEMKTQRARYLRGLEITKGILQNISSLPSP